MAHPSVNDRMDSSRLAEEQAALRRVATLVARGAAPAEVFETVAAEVARLLQSDFSLVGRYEADATLTHVASHPLELLSQLGPRTVLDGDDLASVVQRSGQPTCVNYDEAPGPVAALARALGVRCAVGAPILADDRIWGVMAAGWALPDNASLEAAERAAQFTELVATALANTESRNEITRLAEEQAALRRVATLVARGAPPAEVFEAVVTEVGQLVPGADAAALSRYETDDTLTLVGKWSRTDGYVPVGARYPLVKGTVGSLIDETRRPGRVDVDAEAFRALPAVIRDLGWVSVVGAPILVDGRLWGLVGISSTTEQSLPLNTEERLTEFTELIATAIANAESREALTVLAEEQAALRRVAALVAGGAPPIEVFDAVTAEVGRTLPADAASLNRYDPDGTFTMVGAWVREDGSFPWGRGERPERAPLDRGTTMRLVFETGRPARIDSYEGASGALAALARERGWRSVAAPVIVEGRLWGAMAVVTINRTLPLDTEGRLTEFTELVATAIANAENQAELTASRARIVATADATRRRIERDLHDGAQQQLVSLALELRAAQSALPFELADQRTELSHVVEGLTAVLDELREISRGIHPAILSEGGLPPALKTLSRRSPIPVALDVGVEGRLPESVEVAAYYVVAEMLTNAAKHAQASVVRVDVARGDGVLRVSVRDDGVGGADPARGSGLVGLRDRVEALGGTVAVDSPSGQGTAIEVALPLD